MVTPTNPASRPTVVIACAGIDAPKTHPLARLVVRRGGRVDVLAGVEMDVSAVRDRCDNQGDARAWWLIAESEELDEFQVALIRELLRQGDVAAERVLTISVDEDDCVDAVDAWLQGQPDWCPPAPIGSRVRAKTMLAIPSMDPPAVPKRRTESIAAAGRSIPALPPAPPLSRRPLARPVVAAETTASPSVPATKPVVSSAPVTATTKVPPVPVTATAKVPPAPTTTRPKRTTLQLSALPPAPKVKPVAVRPPAPVVALPPAPVVALPPAPVVALPPAPVVALPPAPVVALPPAPVVATIPTEPTVPLEASFASTRTTLAQEIPPPGRQRRPTVRVTPPTSGPHSERAPAPTRVLVDLPPITETPMLVLAPPPMTLEAPVTPDVRPPSPTPAAIVPAPSVPILASVEEPFARSARTSPTGSWVAPHESGLEDSPRRRWRATATALAATAAVAAAVLLWVRTSHEPSASDDPIAAAVTAHGDDVSRAAAFDVAATDAATVRPAAVTAPAHPAVAGSTGTSASDPLMAALEDRDVRALDDLLVAKAGDGVARGSAAATCNALEIAGTRAWRLPTPGELRQLASARFVRDGHRYWVLGGKKKPAKRAKVSLRSGTRPKKAGATAVAETVCVTTAIAAQGA